MIRTRLLVTALAIALGVFAGLETARCAGEARADVRDSLTVNAAVSAAPHEVEDGYFVLGEDVTVIARPGSELHAWLAAQQGQRIVVTWRERRGVR